MATKKFNSNLSGVAYVAVNEYATIADNDLATYAGGRNFTGKYFYLTGFYAQDGDVTYLQTNQNNVWLVNVGNTPDWIKTDKVSPKKYSASQAQKLVQTIINNNIVVLECNLICARYAYKLTATQRQAVIDLQRRLEARNNALQAGGLTTQIKTSRPSGYAELSDYLDKLMAGEAIGIASWAVVVIAATVVAALSTAAYFSYKALADESAKDVKYSKELTATLMAKLTPEEYNQLMSETKGIVTKSRLKQMVSSYGNVLTIAGIAIGGAILYRWLKNVM